VAPAQATAATVGITLGAAVSVRLARRLGLALRADGMLEWLLASHFAGPGSPSRESRWLPGGDAALEASVWLSAGVALVAAGGVEIAAGRTAILVGGQEVAAIPRARATGELGLRIRF
jgi:hypothetical protein